MSKSPNVVPLRPNRSRCPICRRPAEPPHRPFCSKRCADLDLAKWLGGDYRIPGEEASSGDAGDVEK